MSHSERRIVFLVGCPRSGTTWVQRLLAQHPSVATSPETHVFSRYLRHLARAWRAEHVDPVSERKSGLSNVLSEPEFERLCRDFALGVLGKIAERRPGARVVLEKTPNHVTQWELILRLFPDAFFLHVVRDPRSVVCSLVAAARGWGARWAPADPEDAARRWREDVRRGRAIASATSRYREVRYEAVHDDALREVRALYRWLDLPHDDDLCARAVAAAAVPAEADDSALTGAEPAGFRRHGLAQGWRDEMGPDALASVERITHELMAELGYEPATEELR